MNNKVNNNTDNLKPLGSCILKESIFAILVAFLLSAVFFYPAIFEGRLIYTGDFTGSDLLELNIPMRHIAAQSIKQGTLPHWTCLLGSGLPLLSEGQSGIFYPTTCLFFVFLPTIWAANLSIITTVALAMAGSYFLARVHKCSVYGSAISALAYGLSGVIIFRLQHLNLIQVIAWLPVSLGLASLLAQQIKPKLLALLTVVWAVQILAGHPHASCILFVSTFIYAIFYKLCLDYSDKTNIKNKALLTSLSKYVLTLLACAFLSVTLSALQLGPTYEFVQHSSRGNVISWEKMAEFPFKAEHLVKFVSPFSQGTPALGLDTSNLNPQKDGVFWESTPYFGIVPLILALLYPFILRNGKSLLLSLCALIFLWLAFGYEGKLYWILWQFFPWFDHFRFPCRFLVPFVCLASLFAGLSLDKICSLCFKESANLQKYKNAFLIFLCLVTFLNLFYIGNAYVAYLPKNCLEMPESAKAAKDKEWRVATPTAHLTWQKAVLSRGWKGKENEEFVASRLKGLAPNSSAVWGVKQNSDRTLWEGGIELKDYKNLHLALFKEIRFGSKDGHLVSFFYTQKGLKMLAMQNVGTISSYVEMPLSDENLYKSTIQNFPESAPINYTLSGTFTDPKDSPLFSYDLDSVTPRVRFVGQAIEKPALYEKAISLYQSKEFNTSYSTIIENPPYLGSPYQGQSTIIEETPLSLVITTESQNDGYLVLLDNYYPSWKAYIDGEETVILKADLAFRAVAVKKGSHTISFRMVPYSFYFGCAVSAISLLGLIIGTYLGEKRK